MSLPVECKSKPSRVSVKLRTLYSENRTDTWASPFAEQPASIRGRDVTLSIAPIAFPLKKFNHTLMSQQPQSTYKVVVLGSSGVGKTALVQRLVDNTFSEEGQSTVGVEFKSHVITTDIERAKLNIWDTAGQERFRSVSKAYFRNAVGAILVFSIDDIASFNAVDEWLDDLHKLALPNAVILLVGNKVDLKDKRVVTEDQAIEFAKRHGLEYLETSAKDATNVQEAFVRLTKSITEKVKSGEIAGNFETPRGPVSIGVASPGSAGNSRPQGRSCC